MTATILESSTDYSDIQFNKDICEIKINNLINPLLSPNISKTITATEGFLKFVSPRKKIFISLDPNYYHFHNDSLGILFGYYKTIKDCIIVLDISQITNYENCSFYNFFIEFLKNNSIDYELIKCNKDTVIHANNFFTVNSFPNGRINIPEIVFNFYKDSLNDLNIKPYKNVYLSRKDNRGIDDNNKIEKYFNNLGFEIIYSEDFKNFKEQINYFYSVKTLASLSGAGLTNTIFMQENTLILEIMTPHTLDAISTDKIILKKNTKQLHYFYNLLTFLKNQTYVSVPNINNSADSLVHKLNILGLKQ
jgi:capsular polysaccharide biosynthesis protein